MKPETGWYPTGIEQKPGQMPVMVWQDLEGVPFTDPFFEDTLRRARHPAKPLRRTPLAELPELSPPPSTAPRAFIFHASRCGSTLLTQLLGHLQGSVVVAEPPVMDAVFRAPLDHVDRPDLILHTIRWLAQTRPENDRQFFLKLDSWHLPWLPVIRQAFPGTPCWFLFRHPVEILWSHHRQRGSQMVPGWLPPALFDIPLDRINPADLDGYAAQVLASILHKAILLATCGSLALLGYEGLREDPPGLLERLGFTLSPEEKTAMASRSAFHSKDRGRTYSAAGEAAIPAPILQRLEELAAPRLIPAFEQLELLRNSRPF